MITFPLKSDTQFDCGATTVHIIEAVRVMWIPPPFLHYFMFLFLSVKFTLYDNSKAK
jgi:hypothetical protein